MKKINKNSNSVNKSLKVIFTNPPTEEKAIEIIKKISETISKTLSDKLIELED